MKTSIIIMCAGEGKRWGKDYPKHIALVNGKPNVKRTHDMVVKNGFKPEDLEIYEGLRAKADDETILPKDAKYDPNKEELKNEPFKSFYFSTGS